MSIVSPPDRLQSALGTVYRVPSSAVARTRTEVVTFWEEARSMSKSWGSSEAADGIDPQIAEGQPSADKVYLAWYAGLGVMGALRLIEWRLAAVIAAAHTVERYGHRQRLAEFIEGMDSGL